MWFWYAVEDVKWLRLSPLHSYTKINHRLLCMSRIIFGFLKSKKIKHNFTLFILIKISSIGYRYMWATMPHVSSTWSSNQHHSSYQYVMRQSSSLPRNFEPGFSWRYETYWYGQLRIRKKKKNYKLSFSSSFYQKLVFHLIFIKMLE